MTDYRRFYAKLEPEELYISEMKFDADFEKKMYLGVSLKGMCNPKATIKNASGEKNDFLYSLGISKLVVSEKAKSFLEKSEDAHYFEFFDIEFQNKKIPPFFLLNILELVDAFDWERSQYELFEELGPKGNKVIRDLIKMEIDESKTNNRKLFSLLNHEGNTIVHKDFAEEMIDYGLTGILTDPLWGHTL
ncbi:imm11 family protein [Chryseobacterium oryctis]|uniref:Immunity MXAN-0049 protein domain-containing protein n=1 Tax=Chryseobacterium oryctis TaxID=2952618 RepID=A0ABT3HRN1_9FLAO|nr:DUF1629 domain-containing protein [Chryseobacterium oryctis]MCW3162440.1 hypothetical protein [Chryseobacterium oryctis]